MSEEQENTEDNFDAFIRGLEGAFRVVIETPNALDCMDARYIPASRILTSWNSRADRIEELEAENADLKAKLAELEAERQSQKDYYASRLILE